MFPQKKNQDLYESFQVIIFKYMDIENQQLINSPQDDEYRVYCTIWDKLWIERHYKNHLKLQSHTNNTSKNN